MRKLIIVANLKSYKTQSEAKEWLDAFKNVDPKILEDKQVIICPPFTLLWEFKSFFVQNKIKVDLGSQTVSAFDEGAHTGQINAKQIKDFANFVIVGHSEERKVFKETDEILSQKVDLCIKYGLEPIFCVQNKDTFIPEKVSIVAYEPIFAIGSGNPDTPQNANTVASGIMDKHEYKVLYGGSVTPQNISSFTQQPNILGVLIGGISLDAQEFIKALENAK